MSLRARNTVTRMAASAAKDDSPPVETASKELVQLGLNSALATAFGVAVAMCALAGLLSLFIIWIVPPPGTRDLPTEMPWVRFNAFDASHGAAPRLARAGLPRPCRLHVCVQTT